MTRTLTSSARDMGVTENTHLAANIFAMAFDGMPVVGAQSAIPAIDGAVGMMMQLPIFRLATPGTIERRGAYVAVDLPSVNAILAQVLPDYESCIPDAAALGIRSNRGPTGAPSGPSVFTVNDQYVLLGDIYSTRSNGPDLTAVISVFGNTLVSNLFNKRPLVEAVRGTRNGMNNVPLLRKLPAGAAPIHESDPDSWLMQPATSKPTVDTLGAHLFFTPQLCMPSYLRDGTVDVDVMRNEWATLSTPAGWAAAEAAAAAGDFHALPRIQFVASFSAHKYEPPLDWEFSGIKVPRSHIGKSILYGTVSESQSLNRSTETTRRERAKDLIVHQYLHPNGVVARHGKFDLTKVQVSALMIQMSGGNATPPL